MITQNTLFDVFDQYATHVNIDQIKSFKYVNFVEYWIYVYRVNFC